MAEVVLSDVTKRYGDVTAVSKFTVTVADGEFVTFLGPSGCGKTTVLRSIAGFVEIDSGAVHIGDRVVSDASRRLFVPPEDRRIGMVFQSYAVWPHMSVFENIAYPLKIRRKGRKTIAHEVQRVLELVKMPELARRYPHQLSGGQQQRVALARALIVHPDVLLLDEPLSNLDAKLREELRVEIKDLQRRMRITVIFVTHDQTEAMVMSDRVVLMRDGLIRQVGTPREIYCRPMDSFVAGFIGRANVFETQRTGESVVLAPGLPLPERIEGDIGRAGTLVVVRPEDVRVGACASDQKEETRAADATVVERLYLGDSSLYILEAGGSRIEARTAPDLTYEPGDSVAVTLRTGYVMGGKPS